MKSSKKWPVFHLISDTWMSKVRVIHQKVIFGSRVSPDYLCVFCYFCYFVQNGYRCNAAVQTVLMCDGVLTLFETSAVRRSWMMRFAGCCEQENLIYKSKWLSSTLGTPASQLSTSSSQSVRHSICFWVLSSSNSCGYLYVLSLWYS